MINCQTLVIGTRTSQLALWQTHHIKQQLEAHWPGLECRLETFLTTGDKSLDRPLPQIGGKGLFTAELENALHNGEIDLAVHSLKDLPIENTPGLALAAITARADVRDVLVAKNNWLLSSLPAGAIVGTSSLRRQAQLLAHRPDLQIMSIRGNVDSRIRKAMAGEYDAVVLAAAGLTRLGLEASISEWLPLEIMLPAPGQGALAVQCRAEDTAVLNLLSPLDNEAARACVTAERAFLEQLGGGCSLPVAAYATISGGDIMLTGLVASVDGQKMIRVQEYGRDPHQLGTKTAETAIAQGALELLP
jgi:hydroxymethylbilane synthase